ncbi:MAG: HlyD family efflux transporter periplasmic adaptor subunit [Chloroflexi bacterium]|jgi:HlyD family secretion protein|nr:HlyD family efflux transporter periplasmic adaptor subunit [Chloroflexota bacterium]
MRWKTIGAVLLLVVGIGAAALAVIGPSLGGTATTQYLTSQATITDVVEEVAATGTIEAATTYSLAFGSAPTQVTTTTSATVSSASTGSGSTSWIVETVTATPGQVVKVGDVLATANNTSARLNLAVAEATLASAKARLASDRAGLTAAEKAAAKLQVTQAAQSVSQASSSYSGTVAQNRLKVRQAEAAVSRARSAYLTAKSGGQPTSAIDQAYSAYTQAKESLASLRLQVSQSNTQAANQITQAKLQLQSAQIAYQQKTEKTDAATLATDRAGVAQAEQDVATATSALQYTSLVSPVDGVVVTVAVTPGLASPSTAITVRSTSFQVAAAVTESDLPLIEVGQVATVAVTAFDTDVTGTVTKIDQEPASSTTGVVSYGIVVALPEVPTGTVPGMSAEISVTTASSPSALAVPAIALATASDGTYSVRVLDASGTPQSVAVTVGLITSSLAEIKSGITEGTAVVVGTSSDQQSSSSSTTTRTGIPGLDAGGFPGGGPGALPGTRP